MQFIERRRDGWGMPQPGAARKIADEQVEVLVTRTLTEMGPGRPRLHAMHPGFRLMASDHVRVTAGGALHESEDVALGLAVPGVIGA
jgi:hypothetical protein